MKKITLIFIILVGLFINVQAQNLGLVDVNFGTKYSISRQNNTVPDTNSYFGEKSCWAVAVMTIYQESHFPSCGKCVVQGDIVINQIHYKKYCVWHAIRQENQKIYVFDDDLQKEYLLYDFGVNVGDTIYSDAPSGYIVRKPVVLAVDSVNLFNGERRKRITLEVEYDWGKTFADVWIEGIGSMSEFFNPLQDVSEPTTCLCEPDGTTSQLIAFLKNDTLCYFNSALAAIDYWKTCLIYLGIPTNIQNDGIQSDEHLEIIQENNSIHILGESSVFPCMFKLFSLTGQLIVKKKLQSSDDYVPVGMKGIYLFQIQKGTKILKNGKIIIK